MLVKIDYDSLSITLYNMIQQPNDTLEIKKNNKNKVNELLEKLNLNKFCKMKQ